MRPVLLAAALLLSASAAAQPVCTGGGCTTEFTTVLAQLNELMAESLSGQVLRYNSTTGHFSNTRAGDGTTRFPGAEVEIINENPTIEARCRDGSRCMERTEGMFVGLRIPQATLYQAVQAPGFNAPVPRVDEIARLFQDLVARSQRMAGSPGGVASPVAAPATTRPPGCRGEHRTGVTFTVSGGGTYTGETCGELPHGQGSITYGSGGSYTGSWADGKKHGHGTYTYSDGSVYVGPMTDDRIEGTGRLEYANGEVYEGQFVNSNREGTGTLTIPDGGLYEGEWHNDKSHGTGRMTLVDGSVFEGTYVDGRLHGPGRFTDAGGTTYVGTFAEGQMGEGVLTAPGQAPRRVRWNGERLETLGPAPSPAPAPRPTPAAPRPAPAPQVATPRPPGCTGEHGTNETLDWAAGTYTGETCVGRPHGQGSIAFHNGNRYAGAWVDGRKHGQGTYRYADGAVYVGEMTDDWIEGTGRLTYPSGNVYEGAFVNGTLHGTGTMAFANGNRYTGAWVDGQKSGQGTFRYADGSVYVGEMANDRIEGTGRLEYANGNVYEGQFVNWKREGTGTLTYADGGVFEGTFADASPVEGMLTKDGAPPRPVRWTGTTFQYTDGGASRPSRPAPGCGTLVVDLDAGTMNGIAPTATRDAINAQFPCATGETEEGGPYNFGGGIFFINHDFYFYTHRDFLELRREFRGTTQPALLGRSLASSGLPAPTRTDQGARLYDKGYGCLRVETDDAGVITDVGVHATPCGSLVVPR